MPLRSNKGNGVDASRASKIKGERHVSVSGGISSYCSRRLDSILVMMLPATQLESLRSARLNRALGG
jgi:hypothetical protein